MSLFFETLDKLTPHLLRGEFDHCERMACDALNALPLSPFHLATSLSITNNPVAVAQHFDEFYSRENRRFSVRAVYTEMNGFDINPDRWFCDLFAYDLDGELEDFDWLCEWKSEPSPDVTITGLEELQAVYDSNAFKDPANCDASYLSSIVVVTKFQKFMQTAALSMEQLNVPLYATAHDFDYIARLLPKNSQRLNQ